jgi:hypothetical protein
LPVYIEYFKQHFPALDLVKILASLITSKAFFANTITSKEEKENRTMYLEAITYLLKRDLVVQLHAYFLVMVPKYIKMGYTKEEYEEKLKNSANSDNHGLMINPSLKDDIAIIPSFEKASDSERKWLYGFVKDHPKEIGLLFERFVKILNIIKGIFLCLLIPSPFIKID